MNSNNIEQIIKELKNTYPDAKCSLNFSNAFELGIAVILAAQCTDERVNKTTPKIFSKYKTPKDFVNLDMDVLEELIHSCGFYKSKAKNIKGYSLKIITEYNNIVPQNMEDLMRFAWYR